jgi:hypothetical protein
MVQPMDYKIEKTEFAVGHTKLQRTDLRKYFKQYGGEYRGLNLFYAPTSSAYDVQACNTGIT